MDSVARLHSEIPGYVRCASRSQCTKNFHRRVERTADVLSSPLASWSTQATSCSRCAVTPCRPYRKIACARASRPFGSLESSTSLDCTSGRSIFQASSTLDSRPCCSKVSHLLSRRHCCYLGCRQAVAVEPDLLPRHLQFWMRWKLTDLLGIQEPLFRLSWQPCHQQRYAFSFQLRQRVLFCRWAFAALAPLPLFPQLALDLARAILLDSRLTHTRTQGKAA
mmetsp:Transcript_115434/g.203848  ORF Transcript_115434/g.203848 Transcript_115434/m.203848 type:complete len:222 (-) Transcript_115434:136-801(-)